MHTLKACHIYGENMLILPNNLQNDNENYDYSEQFTMKYGKTWLGFFLNRCHKEANLKAITPFQLDRLIENHHRDFSFIKGSFENGSFNGLITFTSSKTEKKLQVMFVNYEQWVEFYQDFVSFKSNKLSLQSVFDNHKRRAQEAHSETADMGSDLKKYDC